MALSFHVLNRHWLRAFRVPVRPYTPSRLYTTQRPPPKPPTRPERAVTNIETSVNGHGGQHLDGSTAFQPQPFNAPGSPIFGGSSLRDAALTTVVGLFLVFVGGVVYVKWYKYNVLRKLCFQRPPTFVPMLNSTNRLSYPSRQATIQLATYQHDGEDNPPDLEGPWTEHLRRKEQDAIDEIVQGRELGHYFVLLGPKGSGKGTCVFDSMLAIQADGVSVVDAHPDLEVFRLKLGKALNYEYHEDSQTGLFQRRDPREGGPALDIERALNKLEKVALTAARRRGKPLVLIFDNVHYFKNDDDGRAMLLQLQQRAESWAASGIVTCVFMTDDFWPFSFLRKTASRMQASFSSKLYSIIHRAIVQVLSIYDLDGQEALHATTRVATDIRRQKVSPSTIQGVVDIIGGRLSYINKVARAKDMLEMANELLSMEKAWLGSQIGLIPDLDDDTMDEEFVKLRKEQERERDEAIAAGTLDEGNMDLPLPKIPYWRCRQIMTRGDFLEDLDRANIIAIDVHHDVRPESMLILHAARQVVEEEGFDDILENVRDRIDEIESLHRTSEVTYMSEKSGFACGGLGWVPSHYKVVSGAWLMTHSFGIMESPNPRGGF
ncbi:hypothetical protein R3P38DRAFT_3264531 [Favolaschia claudopus]|uniref:Orc1-like AAA ATPase domain-containing protein n=1 Tax=Favolaschia claudopus TaxID=2862362 RepID=A0AAW0C507_9AGAR